MLSAEQRNELLKRATARAAALSQKTRQAARDNTTDAQKIDQTLNDLFGNVVTGALKGLEGIYDAGATVVGAVGGLFDKEFQEKVKEKVKHDWTSEVYGEDLLKETQFSFINEMGEVGQEIVRGTAQGLGQMLPAVAMNVVLPGSGLATIGISAAGSGTEKAFQDGAGYYAGVGYGILSGTVEVLTEKLWGSGMENAVGKGLLDKVMKSTVKTSLWKTAIKNFGQEAIEEMLATVVEPAIRTIYDKDALKDYTTKEQWEQTLKDGLVGGLTSLVYGGTIGQINKTKTNIAQAVQGIKSSELKKSKLWESGLLSEDAENKLNADIEVQQNDLNKKLSKLTEKKRIEMVKKFGIETNEDGTVKTFEYDKRFNRGSYSADLHGKESTLKYAPTEKATTFEQKQAVKLYSALNRKSNSKTSLVFTDELGTTSDGSKIDAAFIKGVMYVDSSITDETLLKRKIVHEVTHSLEVLPNQKKAYWKYEKTLMDAMSENAEVQKLLDPNGDLWKSTQERYKDQLKDKSDFEQKYIITTELVSQFSEKIFTDEKVIQRITRENRNLAQKIYDYIVDTIEYYKSRKGKTDSEKEFLSFLRKAERLYKTALEESQGGVDLKTVEKIGEVVENAETQETVEGEDKPRLSIDSEGRSLTPAQMEFFKDSQVRDENGNLMVLYHGTKNGIFNVFRYDSTKQTGQDYGKAFYFTSDKGKATGYSIDSGKDPRIKANIEKREMLLKKYMETKKKEDKNAFLEAGEELWPLLNDETYTTEGATVLETYLNLKNPMIYDAGGKYFYNVYKGVFAQARDEKHDGIIVKNVIDNPRGEPRPIDVFIAFQENQIKLTSNENPTESDDIRFSVEDKRKVYTAKEIRDTLTDLLAERLQFGSKFGELSKMSEKEMIELFLDEMDLADDPHATADKIAQFIIDNATLENGMDVDEATEEDLRVYNLLRQYHGKVNLDGIKGDIHSMYDKDKSPYAIWGKRKGVIGATPDVIAKELAENGLFIDAINPADIFAEMDRMYKNARDKIKKKVTETKSTISNGLNNDKLDYLKSQLAKDILAVAKEKGKELPAAEYIQKKRTEIKKLKERIAELSKEKAEQTSEMKGEIIDLQHQVDILELELKSTSSRSADTIQRMNRTIEDARREIEGMGELIKDVKEHARWSEYLFKRIDRIKELKSGKVGSGIELAEPVILLAKKLSKIETWRGNLSNDVREIMKEYAKQRDSGKLYDLLTGFERGKDEPSQNPVADLIEEIAHGEGEITTAELKSLVKILDNFVHMALEYDKAFLFGKVQEATPIIEKAIDESHEAIGLKDNIWKKFQNALEAPLWRFERLSNYDPDGVFSKVYWEMFIPGLEKQEGLKKEVVEMYQDWFKQNRKQADEWHKKTTVGGVSMSRGQMLYLYMLNLRKAEEAHLWNRTTTEVSEKGMKIEPKGEVKFVDDETALKNQKEAQEKAKNATITKDLMKEIESSLTDYEKEYIKITRKVMILTGEKKNEVAMALYGITEENEKDYIPARSADDQIYTNLAEKRPGDALFSALKPSFTKALTPNANNVLVIENILDVVERHVKQMATYYGFAPVMKGFNRLWNMKTTSGTLKQAVNETDRTFEAYANQLFKDVQGQRLPQDGIDKFLSQVRSWGARAALGLNVKSWTTQWVSLLASKGVGFSYKKMMKGLSKTLHGKTDFDLLAKYSPIMYARFREGSDTDNGALREKGGMFGKLDKWTDLTTKPIEWNDKMVIGTLWNTALESVSGEGEEKYKKAAKMVEKAVFTTQSNYTSLLRPAIMRSQNSFVNLSTMFKSEPFQVFSQIFGSIDKLHVAQELKKRATTKEEIAKAEALMKKAKEESKNAFVAVSVDMIVLSLIAQAFKWLKGKDDEEEFAVGFGKEMLGNITGMFPIISDIYSMIQGYDVTNMAYTGLTNIYTALEEIYQGFDTLITGKAIDSVELMNGIRKTIVGLAQTFGFPVRNLESYLFGIVDKVSPSAAETYESWFWKKTNAEYQRELDLALEKGQDALADTIVDLMMKQTSSDEIKDEIRRLYEKGIDAFPKIAKTSFTYNSETIELSQKEYKQFVKTYQEAEGDVEKLLDEKLYQDASDEVKADAISIVYDYYYNLAKGELVGEELTNYPDIPMAVLSIVLALTKDLHADKDEEGKSISGSKKAKVLVILRKSGLTKAQQDLICEYLGYTVEQ